MGGHGGLTPPSLSRSFKNLLLALSLDSLSHTRVREGVLFSDFGVP